jgi:hypothetical protein
VTCRLALSARHTVDRTAVCLAVLVAAVTSKLLVCLLFYVLNFRPFDRAGRLR